MGLKEPLELLELRGHIEQLSKDILLIPKIDFEGLQAQVGDSCRESMSVMSISFIEKCTSEISSNLKSLLQFNNSDVTSVIGILSQDRSMKISNIVQTITALIDKLQNNWKGFTTVQETLTDDKVSLENANNSSATNLESFHSYLSGRNINRINVNYDLNGETIKDIGSPIFREETFPIQRDNDKKCSIELKNHTTLSGLKESPPVEASAVDLPETLEKWGTHNQELLEGKNKRKGSLVSKNLQSSENYDSEIHDLPPESKRLKYSDTSENDNIKESLRNKCSMVQEKHDFYLESKLENESIEILSDLPAESKRLKSDLLSNK